MVSQSLWSQGGAASNNAATVDELASLNPFEVREVLQAKAKAGESGAIGLNPFEVREVLQADVQTVSLVEPVSIPLKSGRCCKNTGDYSAATNTVSIPLKSGRCCKLWRYEKKVNPVSQSLWSQGGAARSKNDAIIFLNSHGYELMVKSYCKHNGEFVQAYIIED